MEARAPSRRAWRSAQIVQAFLVDSYSFANPRLLPPFVRLVLTCQLLFVCVVVVNSAEFDSNDVLFDSLCSAGTQVFMDNFFIAWVARARCPFAPM